MNAILKLLSRPIEKKVEKVQEKHKVTFFILKDILKFLKNKKLI